MGEVLGPFRSPGVTQDVPGTPGAEKVMKSWFLFPVRSLTFGYPKITHFQYFSVSVDVFWGMFFGSGFRRPPGIIFEDFGMVSELCFYVLLKMLGGARF